MRAYLYAKAMLDSALTGLRQRLSQDERGMQTVEYVGIGAVVAAIVAAVLTAVEGSGLGDAVVGAIEDLINQVVGGGGGGGGGGGNVPV